MRRIVTDKIAMPLPAATNYPPNKGVGMLGYHDKSIPQAAADEVSNQHPDLSYLNHGGMGIAYEHTDPNTVVKVTKDRDEARHAQMLMGKRLPCCVQVYSVQAVGRSGTTAVNGVWKIIAEKVKPLSQDEEERFETINYVFMNYPDPKAALEAQGLYDEYESELWEFTKLIECLRANQLSWTDLTGGNLGRRADGSLVQLDVG